MRLKHLPLALFMTLIVSTSWGQDLIYYWNFNTNTPATDINWEQPIAATTGDAELSFTFANAVSFGGTDINGVSGETTGGSFCPQGGTDQVNNGKDFILDIPTTGYGNIIITYPTRKTGSGFTQHQIQYTIDGDEWLTKENVDISAYANAWDAAQLVTIDFSSITDANENANFKVKFILTGATTATGNNRFDNIKVLGDVAGAVATPVISPETSNFIEPFDATITVSTDGATIYYTTDGTDPDDGSTVYSTPIAISETTTLKARAYKTDVNPSNIATATYTLIEPQTTTIPYSETFDTDLGQCYVYSVTGDSKYWIYYTSTQAASMNGYGSSVTEEDWMILPGVTLNNDDVTLKFDSWRKYGVHDAGNYFKVLYSLDYEGVGSPDDATWNELTVTLPTVDEAWVSSGNISLSEIVGDNVYIGFKYHYESGKYVQWQVDNVMISEAGASSEAEILTFTLTQQTGNAIINSGDAEIEIEVAAGTNVTSLTPTITVSEGATISPASEVSQNFTSPVAYTVTAEDGSTEKVWTVTVSIATSTGTNTNTSVKVYPNPFTSSVKFENLINAKQIVLSNLIGQQVLEVSINGQSSVDINTNTLPSGIYMATILGQNGEKIIKKVVKR